MAWGNMRHDVEPLVTSKDLARSIPPVAGEIVPLGSVIVFFNTYNNTCYSIIVGYNLHHLYRTTFTNTTLWILKHIPTMYEALYWIQQPYEYSDQVGLCVFIKNKRTGHYAVKFIVCKVPCPLNCQRLPNLLSMSGTWYTKTCMYGVMFVCWCPSHEQPRERNRFTQSLACCIIITITIQHVIE